MTTIANPNTSDEIDTQPLLPAQPTGRRQIDSYAALSSSTEDKLKGDWVESHWVLIGAIVAAIITIIIYYTLLKTHFESGGDLNGFGWVSSNNGLAIFVLFGLALASSVATFALQFQHNMHVAVSIIISTLIIGVLFYFGLDAARGDHFFTFCLLAGVAIGLMYGITIYGFYKLYAASRMDISVNKDRAGVADHFNMAWKTGLVALITITGTLAAAVQIGRHLS